MKSTESKDSRLQRVEMHQYFLDKINVAMEGENYIEASWLIYSCFENRYFRTVEKIRENCKYCRSKSNCNHSQKNELALATKIRCIQRLYENSVRCISESFDLQTIKDTLAWIKDRNLLMHELLSLEYYQETDAKFKNSAEEGLILLNKTYAHCTEFRKIFYQKEYVFIFPEQAMEGCPCKPKTNKEAD